MALVFGQFSVTEFSDMVIRHVYVDPFPNLPRKGAEVGVQPISVEEVVEKLGGAVERGSKLGVSRSLAKSLPPVKGVPKLGAEAKAAIKAASEAKNLLLQPEGVSKGGRPSVGKPWVALGLNERTYRRRKKAGTL